ncbi:hypothetical protein EJB05_53291, partial [Eragrostis curvula]
MRTILLFVAGAIAIYLAATPTTAIPIPANIDDPLVQDLGSWAVIEHVKQANDGIKFNKVVSGVQTFPGLGYNFDLIIDALNRDGKHGKYEAKN